MPHPLADEWAVLVVAAVSVGFAKTAVNGTGAVSAALFALVLPARESTGALLPLLLVADLVAIARAQSLLDLALEPALAAGAVGGVLIVRRINQQVFERVALALVGTSAVLLFL